MLKVKNIELVNAAGVLTKLYAHSGLPYKTARAIGTKVMPAVSERAQEYEKARVDLLKKFGTTTDELQYKVEPENVPAFMTEWDILKQEEVELLNVDKIPEACFAEAGLSPQEWVLINWLLEG